MKNTRLIVLLLMGLLLTCSLSGFHLFADSISFLGSTGGTIRDIAVYEDVEAGKIYLYVAQGAAIIVYDVTDYKNPIEENRFFNAPDRIYNISISDNHLAIACKFHGVRVYSISNPTVPQFVFDIGSNVHEAHISGHLLYYWSRNFGTGTGSGACNIFHSMVSFENPLNIEILENYKICARGWETSPSFLFAADTRVTKPNLYWFYNRALRNVVWNNPNGLGIPPIEVIDEQYLFFPPTMLASDYFGENGFHNIVAVEDKVFITGEEKVYAYNPLIIDAMLEVIETPVENIMGGSYLDHLDLYVPTSDGFQVIDLSDSNHPIKTDRYDFPSFEPKFINNGVAYAIMDHSIILSDLNQNSNEIRLMPRQLSLDNIVDLNSGFTKLIKYPIDQLSHPRDLLFEYTTVYEYSTISVNLSPSYSRFFGYYISFIFVDDISDPENPIPIEVFHIGEEAIPSAIISGNILSIPAGDSGTFHFLLDDALFGTPVSDWDQY